MNDIIEGLEQLIASNQLKRAIDLLISFWDCQSLQKTMKDEEIDRHKQGAIVLSYRLEEISNKIHLDLIDHHTGKIEKNQIAHALLYLLNDLKKQYISNFLYPISYKELLIFGSWRLVYYETKENIEIEDTIEIWYIFNKDKTYKFSYGEECEYGIWQFKNDQLIMICEGEVHNPILSIIEISYNLIVIKYPEYDDINIAKFEKIQ